MNRDCKAFESDSDRPLGIGGVVDWNKAAFSWGYVDLVHPDGSGVVAIWGFANPFVPGTLSAWDAGRRPDLREHVTLCLAGYDRAKPSFYLLQRLPVAAHADPFAGPRLTLEGFEVEWGDEVRISVDRPLPGGDRVQAALSLRCPRDLDLGEGQRSPHRWAPRRLGPAEATIQTDGGYAKRWSGSGYHDGNVSSVPLHELGIARWTWGRVPGAHGDDWVYYLVEGRDGGTTYHLLHIHPDGSVERSEPRCVWGRTRRGRWGLWSHRAFDVGPLRVEVVGWVDDGPFYQRMITQVTLPGGHRAAGVGEVVEVDRMDRGWMAPLTRMAVHDPAQPGAFCALFNGPEQGRVARMLRQWGGA